MVDIFLTSEITVRPIQHMGGDESIIGAMKVLPDADAIRSAMETNSGPSVEGRINYLMEHRHGTPFEHSAATFFVHAPIFVFREWHRHRIGFCLAGDSLIDFVDTNGLRNPGICRTIQQIHDRWENGEVNGRATDEDRIAEAMGLIERGVSIRAASVKTGISRNTIDRHRASADDPRKRGSRWRVRGMNLRVLDEDSQFFTRGSIGDVMKSGVKETYSVRSEAGHSLRCSADHRILTDEGWVAAGELRRGDRIAVVGRRPKFVRLAENPSRCGEEMTYDISVDGPHHNFVANGIVVHNSYNEESARYKPLDPVFWIPRRDRPMVPADNWKPGRPKFLTLDAYLETSFEPEEANHRATKTYERLITRLRHSYKTAYETYLASLEDGIAMEVARTTFPVGIYSSCWVTCNPRSIMAFLSLRTRDEAAKFPSYPQAEIEEAARVVEEDVFRAHWPITHNAFCRHGRVAP